MTTPPEVVLVVLTAVVAVLTGIWCTCVFLLVRRWWRDRRLAGPRGPGGFEK